MNKTEFINTVTRTASKIGFTLKKHSPEILMVAGIVGGVTSAVMACKATTKVSEIIDDTKDKVESVHEVLAEPEAFDAEYTEEDSKKDLVIIYTQAGLKFIKLYGPSILLGAASIACILGSNNIMQKRNAAIAAAYASVDLGFKDYRKRVIDRFGKELDRELLYNVKKKEVEETVTNEDGTESTVTHTIEYIDKDVRHCEYSRCFDDTCPNYSPNDPEANMFFLMQVQNWANDRLHAKGHLYLNEVLDMLGFDRTRAGQIVGWVDDPTNPDSDGFVDFGIFDINNDAKRAFVNHKESAVWLDFNVDGDILALMR